MLIQSIKEQEEEAARMNILYVGMLLTSGENWTWYVDKCFVKVEDAD